MTEYGRDNDSDDWPVQETEKPDQSPANEPLLQEWIAGVVDGNQNALDLLYQSLVGHVYGLALRITRCVPLAEEIVQDTFWQVWRQAPRFDSEKGTVKTWVMMIARSRSLDALRRLEPNEYEHEPETLELIEAHDDTSHNLLVAVEQGHQLFTALALLDPLPRQLVSLAFFRGLSHGEVAEFSGLPLGTVKSHIRRALLTLQELLISDVNEVI